MQLRSPLRPRTLRFARRFSTKALLLLAVAVALAGCGRSTPYALTPVEGRIAYEDGSPIPAESILVRFESLEPPRDPKTHAKPAQAYADPATGEFRDFTTYRYADGVIRGRHKVLLIAKPHEGEARPPIPVAYGSAQSTPLEVDTADSPFTFVVPRPAAGAGADTTVGGRLGR